MSQLAPLRSVLLATSLAVSGCVVPLGALTQPNGQPTAAPVPGATPGTLAATATTVELTLGEERLLGAMLKDGAGVAPAAGAVLWQSTNQQVASIHPTTGQAKGIAPGTTVIIATLVGSNARTQFEVKVVDKFTVRAISVEPANPVLEIGERQALRATVAMANGTVSSNVSWTSSDSTVATVNPTTGEVSALREGRVTIEAAYTVDTRFKGVANVTVVKDKTAAPTAPQPSTVVFGPDVDPGGAIGPVGAPGRFVAQVSGTTSGLYAVDFLDAMTGFAGGDNGTLLRTTTGGAGWEDISAGALAGKRIASLHFSDLTTGLALTSAGLLSTADGGAAWAPVDLGVASGLRSMDFQDAQTGYIFVTSGPTYFRTTDGGATWAKVTVPGVTNVIDVARAGGGDVVLSNDGVYVYDAALGGFDKRQATTASLDGQGGQTASFGSAGANVWLVGGANIFNSSDAGKTWNGPLAPKGADGQAIAVGGASREVLAFSASEVFVISSGGIHTTVDGAHWASATGVSVAGNGLFDADFIDAFTGWIVGDGGTILRYSAR